MDKMIGNMSSGFFFKKNSGSEQLQMDASIGNGHGLQGGADLGGVAGRAGSEHVGGRAHLAHDVVDPALDVGGQRDGPHAGGLGGLQEPREAPQVGHRVARLPHRIVHRGLRAAVEAALLVVQHGAPDAAMARHERDRWLLLDRRSEF